MKRSFERFVRDKYRRNFSAYRFKDIDRKFLLDYLHHELERGAENGNRANIDKKLRLLQKVFVRAKEQGVYNVNPAIFDAVAEYLKPPRTFSKAVSHETMMMIEQLRRRDDRSRHLLSGASLDPGRHHLLRKDQIPEQGKDHPNG